MRKSKVRFSWLLFDILMTCVALYLASLLRFIIPLSMPVNADAAEVGPIGYLFVAIIWSISLVSLGVYEQSYLHSLSAKLKTLLLGVGLSTVLLAGGLYLSFTLRDVPRVLFLYFVVLDGLFLGLPRAAQIWLVRMHFL